MLSVLTGAMSASAAPTYVRKSFDLLDGGTGCLALTQREVVYRIHSAGSEKTPGDTEMSAITSSFAAWADVAADCSDLRFTRGPNVDGKAIRGYFRADAGMANDNLLLFREINCQNVVPPEDVCRQSTNPESTCENKYQCWDGSDSAIAVTDHTYNRHNGAILDVDITFNAAPHRDGSAQSVFTTVDGPACKATNDPLLPSCVHTDIRNTLTHEIGHLIGLEHVQDPTSTMAPNAALAELTKRTIDPESRRALCELYPEGRESPPCGADLTNWTSEWEIIGSGPGKPALPSCGSSVTGSSAVFGAVAALVLLTLARRRR
jgi:hypothetical protein